MPLVSIWNTRIYESRQPSVYRGSLENPVTHMKESPIVYRAPELIEEIIASAAQECGEDIETVRKHLNIRIALDRADAALRLKNR